MDQVSPFIGAIIMTNNYLHDVATGLMLVSFGAIWYISRGFDPSAGRRTTLMYLALYDTVTRLAKVSLVWILLGGVPRTIYYSRLEWAPSAGDTQIAVLIVKHVLVFYMVGAGIYYWRKFGRQARKAREALA